MIKVSITITVIRFEQNTSETWEKNWGFMKEQENSQKSSEQKKTSNLNATNTPFPVKSEYLKTETAQDYLASFNLDAIQSSVKLKDKYSVPCTTSQQYGWAWHSDKIDKFAPYAKGKRNVSRWYSGALESLP
ncbi:hypothetical protein ROZALSC1DRAFT_27434 [Rozella allomycis CSF55]|uniref:Uncharacterized protein n=1 Tax=Rozella allomycis (strain CSF55) TaxID=988480 RepID=A0A075AUM9_ROZAC|nr:hypothetical protein O9G_001329 [Rozella allomycis CSF55]RKP21123.1 hypothetical protein ROZALSC1DRAFT_27434 [Rozella allomycis CSF55]|eukprot:EPZ32427.1 hypothetical protein O9G_001329 [Rozella allomycis CSF55]